VGKPVARARGRNAIVDPELDFRPVPAGTGDGAALVAAMIDEMRELYWDVGDGLDLNSPDMPKAGPAELSPPAGVFLVGYRDGAAVWRWRCSSACPTAAVRSSGWYVVPAARGQGLARVLLHALEDAGPGSRLSGGATGHRAASTARPGVVRVRGLRRGGELQRQPGGDVLRGEAPLSSCCCAGNDVGILSGGIAQPAGPDGAFKCAAPPASAQSGRTVPPRVITQTLTPDLPFAPPGDITQTFTPAPRRDLSGGGYGQAPESRRSAATGGLT
jgi:hypothetical protein